MVIGVKRAAPSPAPAPPAKRPAPSLPVAGKRPAPKDEDSDDEDEEEEKGGFFGLFGSPKSAPAATSMPAPGPSAKPSAITVAVSALKVTQERPSFKIAPRSATPPAHKPLDSSPLTAVSDAAASILSVLLIGWSNH